MALSIVEPVANGSAYELFNPVNDESDVYAITCHLILGIASGAEFHQLQEELLVDDYIYRNQQAEYRFLPFIVNSASSKNRWQHD
jgi:hypothetical protein